MQFRDDLETKNNPPPGYALVFEGLLQEGDLVWYSGEDAWGSPGTSVIGADIRSFISVCRKEV